MFFPAYILLICKLQAAVVKTLLIQSLRIANQMNRYKLNYKFFLCWPYIVLQAMN